MFDLNYGTNENIVNIFAMKHKYRKDVFDSNALHRLITFLEISIE